MGNPRNGWKNTNTKKHMLNKRSNGLFQKSTSSRLDLIKKTRFFEKKNIDEQCDSRIKEIPKA